MSIESTMVKLLRKLLTRLSSFVILVVTDNRYNLHIKIARIILVVTLTMKINDMTITSIISIILLLRRFYTLAHRISSVDHATASFLTAFFNAPRFVCELQ